MGKRTAALAALLLMAGFITACGGDDDDDDDVAADDTSEESTDDDTVDGGEPITDFCADFNDDTKGDTAIDEVQASLDTALAAQAETDDQTFADALGLLAEFTQAVIDGDDGDGVITDAEIAAVAPEFETLEDAIGIVTESCSAGG